MRDRLPTLPHDLSEYALVETGPSSWSAVRDAAPFPGASDDDDEEELADDDLEEIVEEEQLDLLDGITTGDLLDVRPSDVPYLAVPPAELRTHDLDSSEEIVLALLDGTSTLEKMLEMGDVPSAELLSIVCELCARGIVTLQRRS